MRTRGSGVQARTMNPSQHALYCRSGRGSTVMRLALLALTAILLAACSAGVVKLTPERVDLLSSRFIGKEFVFRVDWHRNMLVYKGRPVNNRASTYHNETPGVIQARNQRGPLVARAGDVATFTRVEAVACCALALYFTTQHGVPGFIVINTPNKEVWLSEFYEDLTDQMATDAWVEQQLTQETITFLAPRSTVAQKKPAGLPNPPKPLVLSPSASPLAKPVVSALAIKTEPSRVARGQVLSLTLDYTIQSPGESPVAVNESLTLLFNGKPLPTYPRTRTEQRSMGNHKTVFRQTIPSEAEQGEYAYKGEVCIETECTSRTLTFEVVPAR